MGKESVLLDLVEGTVESVKREIELQVSRTARSTIIREQHDHRAGIHDAKGRSISSVSFAANVFPILKRFPQRDIYEEDVFIWNDCYKSDGGITHLPDICITLPAIYQGEIVGYSQVFGHTSDVGGAIPGSIPIGATEIFQEGLMIPPLKLYEKGELNAALYKLILNNSRYPDELEGDIDAFVAAARIGVDRLLELCHRYGRDQVEECFELLLERCARDLRDIALPQIPDGTYAFEDFCEYIDIVPDEGRKYIRLRVTMTKTPEKVIFDFAGTDRQVLGSINWPGNGPYYAKFLATLFKSLVPEMVVNDGATRVIEVGLPQGTVLSPEFPAACSNRHWMLLRLLDVGQGVLGKALGGNIPASCESISVYGVFGQHNSQSFLLREITGAGSGGRPYADGNDTVDVAPESKNIPAEFAEIFFPVRIERLGLAKDSGGPGKYRGGLGYFKDIRFLAEGTLIITADRCVLQPWGVKGGKAGKGSSYIINPGAPGQRVLTGKTDRERVKKGDLLRVMSPGGGGWGDPLERDPEAVRLDVLRGLVSRESAYTDYGVVVEEDEECSLLLSETEYLREAVRGERRVKLFDRGETFIRLLAQGEITLTTDDER